MNDEWGLWDCNTWRENHIHRCFHWVVWLEFEEYELWEQFREGNWNNNRNAVSVEKKVPLLLTRGPCDEWYYTIVKAARDLYPITIPPSNHLIMQGSKSLCSHFSVNWISESPDTQRGEIPFRWSNYSIMMGLPWKDVWQFDGDVRQYLRASDTTGRLCMICLCSLCYDLLWSTEKWVLLW